MDTLITAKTEIVHDQRVFCLLLLVCKLSGQSKEIKNVQERLKKVQFYQIWQRKESHFLYHVGLVNAASP